MIIANKVAVLQPSRYCEESRIFLNKKIYNLVAKSLINI